MNPNNRLSNRSSQADGTSLITSPRALGLNFAHNTRIVLSGAVGKLLTINVPSDLPRRKLYCFIAANDEVATTEIRGVVKAVQNGTNIAELPILISVTTAGGFSIAGTLQTNGMPVTEDGLAFDVLGQVNYCWPIHFELQCDTFELWLEQNVMPLGSGAIGLACLSQAI